MATTATEAATVVATAAEAAAIPATVAAATAKAATATVLARLIEAQGHERVDHLVKQGQELLGVLLGEAGDEVLALALGSLGALDGVVLGEDDHLAHVGLLRLDSAHEVLLLGIGQHGVELAQAHAQEVGHLLLLHLGLELQELEGAHERARLALVLLGGALEGDAATEQQVLGALHLRDELLVDALLLLGVIGIGIARSLGVLLVLGDHVIVNGRLLGDLLAALLVLDARLVNRLVVLELRHCVSFLRLLAPTWALPRHRAGFSNSDHPCHSSRPFRAPGTSGSV